RWHAWAGAVWSLRSNRLRPAGWTSADAAGLPIFPGLARWDEARRGVIDHALRFTAARTRRAYVWPARHYASSSTDPSLPPMGLRVRLKASFDVRPFPRQARIVMVALKRYGMLLADNGSNWYISGAPSPRTGRKRSWPRSITPALRSPPTRLRLCASSSAGPLVCLASTRSRKPGANRSTWASIRSATSTDEPFGTWQYAQAVCFPDGAR